MAKLYSAYFNVVFLDSKMKTKDCDAGRHSVNLFGCYFPRAF